MLSNVCMSYLTRVPCFNREVRSVYPLLSASLQSSLKHRKPRRRDTRTGQTSDLRLWGAPDVDPTERCNRLHLCWFCRRISFLVIFSPWLSWCAWLCPFWWTEVSKALVHFQLEASLVEVLFFNYHHVSSPDGVVGLSRLTAMDMSLDNDLLVTGKIIKLIRRSPSLRFGGY